MNIHRITSKIEGDLFSRLLLLEGEIIDLNPDGTGAFGSTNSIDVIGALNVAVIVRGLVGTEWTLTVSEGTNNLVSEKRTIQLGNRDSFAKTVNVASSGAGASKGLAAAAAGTKKGGAKKGGAKKGGK